jgi:pyridoxamine 5'-phosphate oxidase family protein
MQLDHAHIQYLLSHHQGRLATIAPNGAPQHTPVGFRYNPDLGTIDIAGYDMESSAKYRNIATNPHVAFIIDDAIGEGPSGMRFLEIRGTAEQAHAPAQPAEGQSTHIIRIHPRRIVSWNVDPDHPGLQAHTLAFARSDQQPPAAAPTNAHG